MLKDLPVEVIEYFLPSEEQKYPECGSDMHIMDKNIRQELKLIHAEVKVVEHISYVYSCRECEKNNIKTPVIKAPMDEPVIKGSIASPYILCLKSL